MPWWFRGWGLGFYGLRVEFEASGFGRVLGGEMVVCILVVIFRFPEPRPREKARKKATETSSEIARRLLGKRAGQGAFASSENVSCWSARQEKLHLAGTYS